MSTSRGFSTFAELQRPNYKAESLYRHHYLGRSIDGIGAKSLNAASKATAISITKSLPTSCP
ncbi:hypothetical protein [Paenibacillus periandrae]|uniref:hypothetical protein n=1 Tax=Paenibacillus periandrae TaxID=1761741 RepID=UPI001F09B189|nr:hypothetical protein [Paenibacillus periandrae]